MSSTYVSQSSPRDEADDEYIEFGSFSRRLRQRFWLPLLLLLVGMALAFWVSARTPVSYESKVRILFPGTTGAAGLGSLASSLGVEASRAQPMDMYAEVLKSTRIAQPIIAKYHLERYKIKAKTPEDVDDIVDVKTNTRAATLTLTVSAPRAALAPLMANDFCNSLASFVHKASLSDKQNSSAFLAKRISDIEDRLQKKDEELRRYQEKNRLAGAAGANASGVAIGATLASQLNQVTASLKSNEARIAEVRRQLALQVDHPERLAVEDTPLAQKWREQLSAKMHDLALKEAQWGPDHPDVVMLKKDISDIKAQIAKEISGARYGMEQGIAPGLAQLLAEREALTAQQASLNDVISKIPAQEMHVVQLTRENLLLSTLYNSLQQKYQEAQLAEMNDPSRYVVLDEPSVPLRPARPRWKRNLAMGGLAGLVLGIFFALSLPVKPEAGNREEGFRPTERLPAPETRPTPDA